MINSKGGPYLAHKIGRVEDPSCPCRAAVQSGEHIVWQCSAHRDERRRNRVQETRGWEDLEYGSRGRGRRTKTTR